MRYDYKIILLLINNKWKITHAYGYRPLQNGYLERLNVYLNDTITQNILGELLLPWELEAQFFSVTLHSLKVLLIFHVVRSHMQTSWVMRLTGTTRRERTRNIKSWDSVYWEIPKLILETLVKVLFQGCVDQRKYLFSKYMRSWGWHLQPLLDSQVLLWVPDLCWNWPLDFSAVHYWLTFGALFGTFWIPGPFGEPTVVPSSINSSRRCLGSVSPFSHLHLVCSNWEERSSLPREAPCLSLL